MIYYLRNIVSLKADNEWEAAEHLALWLASNRDGNVKPDLIVITMQKYKLNRLK